MGGNDDDGTKMPTTESSCPTPARLVLHPHTIASIRRQWRRPEGHPEGESGLSHSSALLCSESGVSWLTAWVSNNRAKPTHSPSPLPYASVHSLCWFPWIGSSLSCSLHVRKKGTLAGKVAEGNLRTDLDRVSGRFKHPLLRNPLASHKLTGTDPPGPPAHGAMLRRAAHTPLARGWRVVQGKWMTAFPSQRGHQGRKRITHLSSCSEETTGRGCLQAHRAPSPCRSQLFVKTQWGEAGACKAAQHKQEGLLAGQELPPCSQTLFISPPSQEVARK